MQPETNLFLDVFEHVDGFAHESLVDNTKHFGLLEDLATHVEWKVFTVDDTSHESQPSRHQLLKLVVDEYPLYVQFHGLALLVEHIPIQLKRHLRLRKKRKERKEKMQGAMRRTVDIQKVF